MESMKVLLLVFYFLSLLVSCSPTKHSKKECKGPVKKVFLIILQESDKEKQDQLMNLKDSLLSMMEKECRSGEYELSCLQKVEKLTDVQACKKMKR